MDWVNKNITFGYKFARHNKTAYDTWYEKKGVCRDYQHLAIALLRALNIPARYATGYLGDIGARRAAARGFFRVDGSLLGGKWVTLDARHNTPRIGRVLMARGRDATDVALTTSFGPAKLCGFKVWTEECGEGQISQPDGVFIPPPPAIPLVPAAKRLRRRKRRRRRCRLRRNARCVMTVKRASRPVGASPAWARRPVTVEQRRMTRLPDQPDLIPYASHVAHGTGRTPIGIICLRRGTCSWAGCSHTC
jgi:hypothetical protein